MTKKAFIKYHIFLAGGCISLFKWMSPNIADISFISNENLIENGKISFNQKQEIRFFFRLFPGRDIKA